MEDPTKKIKDKEIYEKIVFDNDSDKDMVLKALEIVKLYIIKSKLILVGGMAIDYALRKKNKKLYPDGTLPDYDFFSPNFHHDAYNIANELYLAGLTGIGVINAFHASTMRVRVKFQVVADCTYVPLDIYNGLPTVTWENFRIIHPHYQMLNQHLSFSLPYSGNVKRFSIHRWKKDIKRFDILDTEYPVGNKYEKAEMQVIESYQLYDIPIKKLEDFCLNGFGALLYWFELAKLDGFSESCTKEDLAEYKKLGSAKIVENKLKVKMPVASIGNMGTLGLCLHSDNREILKHPFLAELSKDAKNIKRYNAFLDLMPRRILIDDRYEIIDNRGNLLAAHKEKIWLSNIQVLLRYFSLNFMVSFNILKLRDGYCFYLGYKLAYDIVKWAAKIYKKENTAKIAKYLPTQEVFGKYNWHETYVLQRKIFQMTVGKIQRELSHDKPSQAFIDSEEDYPINSIKYDFKPEESNIYNFDYREHKGDFEPIYLYDPDIDSEP
jgi:hypothetical protein